MKLHSTGLSPFWGAMAFGALALAQPVLAQQVQTDKGVVAGFKDGPATAFLGIPYAATTAGDNRWRAPQPVAAWKGLRAAIDFGPNCAQDVFPLPAGLVPWTPEYMLVGKTSEDCLSLNVWTPQLKPRAKLPVFVWIHGGGFGGGSSTVPIYRGNRLAAKGVVVVTINYRVGPFGFLAHPALTAEAGSSGNYGLMDQVAALQWVKRNIVAFGGDPAQVTLAGQSAGAASVHNLLASPSAAGLFARAIPESGSGMGVPVPDMAQAEALGEKLAKAAGGPDLAALRALPPEALLKAASDPALGPRGAPKFVPVQGGAFLPDAAKQRVNVPVLTGLTQDEASVMNPHWTVADDKALADMIAARFGESAAKFAPLYPANGHPRDAARQVLTDRGIAGMTNWYSIRPANAAPVYAYVFTHLEPGPDSAKFGRFHSSEIPYVFDTLDASPKRGFATEDRKVVDVVQRYWMNFIRTGNPNGAGAVAWPDFRTGKLMRLNAAPDAAPALSSAKQAAYRDYVKAGGKLGIF